MTPAFPFREQTASATQGYPDRDPAKRSHRSIHSAPPSCRSSRHSSHGEPTSADEDTARSRRAPLEERISGDIQRPAFECTANPCRGHRPRRLREELRPDARECKTVGCELSGSCQDAQGKCLGILLKRAGRETEWAAPLDCRGDKIAVDLELGSDECYRRFDLDGGL